jgi:hypothetical protein
MEIEIKIYYTPEDGHVAMKLHADGNITCKSHLYCELGVPLLRSGSVTAILRGGKLPLANCSRLNAPPRGGASV